MDGAERIALKHVLLDRLVELPWSTMTMVLDEVGIGVQPMYETSQHDVAWQSIAEADDRSLLEVQRILDTSLALSQTVASGPWRHDGALRMFISHVSSEKVFAEQLRDQFDKYGIEGFVADGDRTKYRVGNRDTRRRSKRWTYS